MGILTKVQFGPIISTYNLLISVSRAETNVIWSNPHPRTKKKKKTVLAIMAKNVFFHQICLFQYQIMECNDGKNISESQSNHSHSNFNCIVYCV